MRTKKTSSRDFGLCIGGVYGVRCNSISERDTDFIS